MIYFIYGEDNFRSSLALKKIETDFVKEHGDLNIEKLDGDNLRADVLEAKVSALPFLGDKRLIIINNFLTAGKKEEKERIVQVIKSIPETSDLVFFENILPDRRESIFKVLDKLPFKQFFPQLDDFGLKQWIVERISQQNFGISSSACARLIAYVGSDLFRLQNEIARLIDFVRSDNRSQIEDQDVNNLIEPNNNYKIFDLTDAIAQKNINKAIMVLHAFKKSGEDDYRIFNLIVHQIRTMLVINDFSKKMTGDQMAKEAGIHPFVVKKTMANLRNFPKSELIKMYSRLEEIDWKSKNGIADIAIMTELLIVDFCRKC